MAGINWAIIAAAAALAAASGVGLEARVAKVASRALVWTTGEAHWGQIQRRWRDPPAERAVDGSGLSQNHHIIARWTRRLGRGKRHISQREMKRITFNFAALPAEACVHESYDTVGIQWGL